MIKLINNDTLFFLTLTGINVALTQVIVLLFGSYFSGSYNPILQRANAATAVFTARDAAVAAVTRSERPGEWKRESILAQFLTADSYLCAHFTYISFRHEKKQ